MSKQDRRLKMTETMPNTKAASMLVLKQQGPGILADLEMRRKTHYEKFVSYVKQKTCFNFFYIWLEYVRQMCKKLKQTKSKILHHFWGPTFHNKELSSLVRKDSFTLKVLKMEVVFRWDYTKLLEMNNAAWLWSIFATLSQRQIPFLGPLEWRNLFGPKDKVSSYEKLVFRSAVWFLIRRILSMAIC